jgi:alpha-beta hydrolase superfamily lysophospholipase
VTHIAKALAVIFAAFACLSAPAFAAPPSLDDFTQPNTFRGAALSPDGTKIAGVRHEKGMDVLIVLDWTTKKVKPIQYVKTDQEQWIDWAEFKGNDRIIFSSRAKIRVAPGSASAKRSRRAADDGFMWVSRIFSTSTEGGTLLSLYEPGGDVPRRVSANLVDIMANDDDNVLIAGPSIQGTKLLKINVKTGKSVEVERGDVNTGLFVLDSTGAAVLRQDVLARGKGFAWKRRAPGTSNWVEVVRFMGAQGANSGPTFNGEGPAIGAGKVFVLARPEGKDTSGLYIFNAATGAYDEEVLSVPGFDVTTPYRDTDRNVMLAACYWGEQWKCVAKDEVFAKNWPALEKAFPESTVRLVGRSRDNSRWFINVSGPQDLGSYYLYDLKTKAVDYVGGTRPNLLPADLPNSQVVHYTSRDGTALWGYLWTPPGVAKDTKNLPLIVLPHGGPEGRDIYGSDPFAMWWAANGYAVFQPNFRGGGGFGRSFVEAGHRQWGQRMQEDVIDGAKALVASGQADANRMCMAGWSYGGYSTMIGAVINQDTFKCFFAGAGVSDQIEMLRWTREGGNDNDVIDGGGGGRQGVAYKYWSQAQGDETADYEMLKKYSANQRAAEIKKPLLLIHGDEDETVPTEQSVMLEESMRKAGNTNVKLILLKDEGHQWSPMTVENRQIVLGESLKFFQQHLGPGIGID